MSYHIYELVEGPDSPTLKKRQRCLAWASTRAHLRRAALDIPYIVCTYGAEVDENTLEAAAHAEVVLKTRWLRYTLDEFLERLKRDLSTYHEETPAPAEGGTSQWR